MEGLMMRLSMVWVLTSLVAVQCMAQKSHPIPNGEYVPIAWRRVLDLRPLVEHQQPQILAHTRSTKQLFQFLSDLFSSPDPSVASTTDNGPTTTDDPPKTTDTAPVIPDPAPGSGSNLSKGMGTLLGAIAKLADNDDVVEDVSVPQTDSICDCSAVQDDVVREFFNQCDLAPDVTCCGALKRAGADTISGCQCASTVACKTVPFGGPDLMLACGYDMGHCV